MENKGCVYVLTNESFKDDWVKIGKSSRTPGKRKGELSNTSLPFPFEIFAVLYTAKYNEAEKAIHNMLQRHVNLRVSPNREFFSVDKNKLVDMLNDVISLLEDDAKLEIFGDSLITKVQEGRTKKQISKNFSFIDKGIAIGEKIQYIDNSSIEAEVYSYREVIYKDQIYTLSRLVKDLKTLDGTVSKSGSYRGPMFFKYKGVILSDIEDK